MGNLVKRIYFRLSVGWGEKSTGLFKVEELNTAEGFMSIKDSCLKTSAQLVEEACDPNRNATFIISIEFPTYVARLDMIIAQCVAELS